jgi:hypothetical protein
MDIPVTMMIAMSMGSTSRATRFIFMFFLPPISAGWLPS